jgi:hypothetical protein
MITLMRRDGEPPFIDRDTRLVASLSELLGEALRTKSQPSEPMRQLRVEQPGMLVFDATGELVSANEAAWAWLDEVPPDWTLPTAPAWRSRCGSRSPCSRRPATEPRAGRGRACEPPTVAGWSLLPRVGRAGVAHRSGCSSAEPTVTS